MTLLSSSSMSPSQSSSRPLQVSVAPGFTAASASSQSVSSLTTPLGVSQVVVLAEGSPYPSASPSAYQVVWPVTLLSSSSTSPSQSSSVPLQISVAPGFTAASPSSQSLLSATWVLPPSQSLIVLLASP